jgi:predicted enzyme related to lactoylglutathione lyase
MRWGLAVITAMLCIAVPTTQVVAAETHPAAFVAIDHPGAGTGIGQGTFPQGTNNHTVVGYYVDSGGLVFGWRYDEGRFTDINDPSADNTAAGHGTTPITLSNNGREVVGYYADATGLFHGFTLRGGRYTTLDVPFAGASGTFAQGVDDAGLISGAYLDSSGNFHGFILWDGQYRAVNYPGPAATGTALVSMNNQGTVAAVWDQGTATHGFLYRSGKVVAHIDDPKGAGATFPFCVNDHMTAAGQYTDAGGTTHGFTWDRGRYTTIDDPTGTTSGLCIADNGTIVGITTDANGAAHGFITRADND